MLPPGFGTAAMVYSNLSTALVFGTHRVCPSSGSDVGELAEVDKHPLLALGAADPTVGPAALRRCRTTFFPCLDFPHTWVKPRKSNVVPPASRSRVILAASPSPLLE